MKKGSPFLFLCFPAWVFTAPGTLELPSYAVGVFSRSPWGKGKPSRLQANMVGKRRVTDREGGCGGRQFIIKQQMRTVVFH